MTDAETIAVYNAKSGDYAEYFAGTPSRSLLSFIELFEQGDHMLDLGCGPANAAAEMVKFGMTVDAVDASPEMIRLANETFGQAHAFTARVATFDDINQIDVYHGVWANFSLLHAPLADFPRHLKALHAAMRANGYFHIGMKTGEGEKRDHLGRKYAYYSKEVLFGHLEDAGFEPLSMKTGAEKGLAGKVEPWITVLSRKR